MNVVFSLLTTILSAFLGAFFSVEYKRWRERPRRTPAPKAPAPPPRSRPRRTYYIDPETFAALTPAQQAVVRRRYVRDWEYRLRLRLEEGRDPPRSSKPHFPLDSEPMLASRRRYVRIAIQGAAAAAALVSTILALLGYWS